MVSEYNKWKGRNGGCAMNIVKGKRSRIIDTFAARDLQPGKKITDAIVEQRAAKDGFKLEISRRMHAKRKHARD